VELFGYNYFIASCLFGPYYEYNDYVNYIHSSNDYSNMPSTLLPAILRFLAVLPFGIFYFLTRSYTTVEYFLSLDINNGLFYYFFIFMFMNYNKAKYHFAFGFTDTSLIASGLGYNEAEKSFNKILSNDIMAVETCCSIDGFFKCWNITYHNYFLRYFYSRVAKLSIPNPKVIAKILTFLFSALWHGLYPNYHMVFIFVAIFTVIEPGFFSQVENYSQITPFNYILKFLCWFNVSFLSAFFLGILNSFQIDKMLFLFKKTLYIPIAYIGFIFVLTQVLKILKPRKAKTHDQTESKEKKS